MLPLTIILIGIAMYMLSSTTEDYLCPALEEISEKCNFS